jgi:hypothetical protein
LGFANTAQPNLQVIATVICCHNGCRIGVGFRKEIICSTQPTSYSYGDLLSQWL